MGSAVSPTTPSRPERDPRASLQNLLSDPSPPPPQTPHPSLPDYQTSAAIAPATGAVVAASTSPALPPPLQSNSQDALPDQEMLGSDSTPQNDVAMTTTTRRNAGGTVSSVYSGNRIKYLKKEDGIPFWRKDIQYAFLKMVFEDDKRVFTRFSDKEPGHTFAEVYIDAMANSSKCSQILKDKLLSDRWEELGRPEPTTPNAHSPAIDMAMVCLLVNVGRMNTTINFFPEMRARVRTFHSIPCLQANAGPMAYKQLQDGPRLKSILKGALEDVRQPATIPVLIDTPRPRTNPVSLVFLFANYAPKISELHFPPSRDFFDIFMRETLTSKSRATAFLSLMWWYMESDLSADDVKNNPYGSGADDDLGRPFKVPAFEMLSEEEAAKENEDPEDEIEFGERKRKEREAIMANDEPPLSGTKRGKGSKEGSARHPNGALIPQIDDELGRLGEPLEDVGFEMLAGNRSPEPITRFTSTNATNSQPARNRDRTLSPSLPGRRPRSMLGEPDKSQDMAPRKERGDREAAATHPRGKRQLRPIELSTQAPLPYNDPTQVPYEYRPKPTLAPAIGPYQNPPQYPHAGSPYGTGQVYAPNGDVNEQNLPPPRPPSGQVLTEEQQRFVRVSEIVDQNLRILQKAKRREKRRRGVLMDAWIKARSLEDGWDTEEDQENRMGGLNELNEASLFLKVGESSDARPVTWATIDAGREGEAMAQIYRKLGKKLKQMDSAEKTLEVEARKAQTAQKSERSRSAARQDLDTFHWQQGQRPYEDTKPAPELRRNLSAFPHPPPHEHNRSPVQPQAQPGPVSFGHPRSQPMEDVVHPSPGTPDQQPNKRRRRQKHSAAASEMLESSLEGSPQDSARRPPTSSGGGSRDDRDKDRSYSWVPKGRRRKDSDVNRPADSASLRPGSLRPGEMGIPTDVFFSDNKVAEQGVGAGTPTSTKKRKGRGEEGAEDDAEVELQRDGSEVKGETDEQEARVVESNVVENGAAHDVVMSEQ